MKNYAPNAGDQRGYGFGFLFRASKDEAAPIRPTLSYAGPPGFAMDQLVFQTTPFASTNFAAFSAVQWRVGQISAPGLAGYAPNAPCRYEIEPRWTSPDSTEPVTEMRLPVGVCRPGHTYRVRVR